MAALLIFLVGGALSTLLIGCADPQKRYEVLSLFFDGVPDPNAPLPKSTKVSSSGRRTVVHKPFADNLCNSCHLNSGDIFARAQVKPDVCLNCHSNVPTQHAVMHGPVVNNACQMCHSPHSSAVPHLLKQPAPAVCTQCHEPETMPLLHKQPLDPKQSCIDCHSGHGGTDHRLLLATLVTPATPLTPAAPETPPSPASPSPPPSVTPLIPPAAPATPPARRVESEVPR